MVRTLILMLSLLLGACGFQLRGSAPLPFKTIYINLPAASDVGVALRRQLWANGNVTQVDSADQAEAVFVRVADERSKNILSVNSQGLVREHQLVLRYTFRLTDKAGRILLPDSVVTLTRDITYSETALLAKNQEEQLLWRDMVNDMTQQMLRRLTLASRTPVTED